MKILTSGMGWIDLQPGGLNRYFADYTKALHSFGHSELGLIVAPKGEAPDTELNITNVTDDNGSQKVFQRMKSVRNHFTNAIKTFKPDIFNPHFALYATMITKNMIPPQVPVVTHFHGPWAMESKVEEKKIPRAVRETRYFLKKQVEQLTYRRSDGFIVLSEYFKDILTEHYGVDDRRIHIVPGAVDHIRFQPPANRDQLRQELNVLITHRLLFCARRLVRRMGIDRLILSMPEVIRSHPNVRLVIAGDGPLRNEFNELIEKNGLSSHVKLLGRVTNEELVQWYQAADFSIVPTITLEGFGLVTVESLACGTPVLGTPYGGTKEILNKLSDDLMFSDSTPAAMSTKIIDILNNKGNIPTRSECREHVLQRYTWDRVAASVTDIFQEEIRKRKVARV